MHNSGFLNNPFNSRYIKAFSQRLSECFNTFISNNNTISLPLVKEGDSHHQKMRGSEVSGVDAWAWVWLVEREMAWWAGTSQSIAQNHPGDHPAAPNQSLHSGSRLHQDLPPLHYPVSQGQKRTYEQSICKFKFISKKNQSKQCWLNNYTSESLFFI